MKVGDDAKLREQVAHEESEQNRQRVRGHCSIASGAAAS